MNTAKLPPHGGPRRNVNAVLIAIVALIVIGGLLVIANRRNTGDENSTSTSPDTSTVLPTSTVVLNTSIDPATDATAASEAVDEATTTAPTAAPTSTAAATATTAQATTAAPTTSVAVGTEALLFWNNHYVGHWEDSQFVYATSDGFGPGWVRGASVQLRNHGGASYDGSALECTGQLVLSPPPPATPNDDYWYSEGAAIAVSNTNDDRALDAMNTALTALGIDPTTVGSYGAPLAADGSIDRLLWYPTTEPDWVATFNGGNGTFTNVDGEPGVDADYLIGTPSGTWIDLDNDGNLESHMILGDQDWIYEWSSGQSVWSASPDSCGF